ncbi:MFS general substrate transporter [Mycena maculata]|uniref:MFS general substrate transporter n=1 Tax=Mycena maculata TaxID=230809 RepID=A0AAD7MSR2_9AGAR|nr:MFS general substrate transporter [Mycena maculata]
MTVAGACVFFSFPPQSLFHPRWLVLFSTFGYLYSFGVYEDWLYPLADFYVLEFLTNHSPSSIAIPKIDFFMMPFALGIVSGKLFDNGAVEIAGGTLIFMLSLGKPSHYYQVVCIQGVAMGLGAGLTFVPSGTIISHHFSKRRSLATGVVMSGRATIFPISKSSFMAKPPVAESVECSNPVLFSLCLVVLLSPPMVLTSAPFLGRYYYPFIYIQLFSVQHSVSSGIAFYLIAIVNGTSAFGRVAANYLAGPFNLQVICTPVTAGTIWAVLGVYITYHGTVVLVNTLYNIFSRACKARALHRLPRVAGSYVFISTLYSDSDSNFSSVRTGIALALGSFGALGSAPIQGAPRYGSPMLSSDFLLYRTQSIVIASAVSFSCTGLLAGKRGRRRVDSLIER